MTKDDLSDAPRYFIENHLPQFTAKLFKNDDGIDFYVDSLRFLPDNVTVSKLQITAFDLYKNKISLSAGGLPDIDLSTSFHHIYNFRTEFRQQKYNPTTVLLITIYTIDRTND